MRVIAMTAVCAVAFVILGAPALGADGAIEKKLYDQAKPSLVSIKYTWKSEMRDQEVNGPAVVVRDDGLVMVSLTILPAQLPENQIKDLKIIIPSDNDDETEIDAVLQGRDERSNFAFLKPAASDQKWKPVQFVDAPFEIGDDIYSVGILPKSAGYRTCVMSARISAKLRGPMPGVLVDGALAGPGAVVFNTDGQAIGYVHPASGESDLTSSRTVPPKIFVPTSDFLRGVQDPPEAGKPMVLPWMGCELKGLEKETADYYGLKNKPSIQIGDVVADSAADKAGLKANDIIVKMNGQPLERGDAPDELPGILTRKLQWLKPGQTVTFSIINQQDRTPRDVTVTLGTRPKQPGEVRRFFAEELGFVIRESVFLDTYARKLKNDAGGVAVALVIPNGAAAAAHLQNYDLVTQMNGNAITDLDQFKKDYQQFRKDRPKDPLVLVVSQQNGKEHTINIEPPQKNVVPGGDNEQ